MFVVTLTSVVMDGSAHTSDVISLCENVCASSVCGIAVVSGGKNERNNLRFCTRQSGHT